MAYKKITPQSSELSRTISKKTTETLLRLILPYDDIHDQEVPDQTNDADDHVDNHDGDLHPCRQQSISLIVGTAEVALEERVVVELEVSELGQQEVIRKFHLCCNIKGTQVHTSLREERREVMISKTVKHIVI